MANPNGNNEADGIVDIPDDVSDASEVAPANVEGQQQRRDDDQQQLPPNPLQRQVWDPLPQQQAPPPQQPAQAPLLQQMPLQQPGYQGYGGPPQMPPFVGNVLLNRGATFQPTPGMNVPTAFAPPAMSAREALLQRKLQKLRVELEHQVEEEDEEDKEAIIAALLEDAHEKIPLYEKARQKFRGLVKEAGDVVETIKATVNMAVDLQVVTQERNAMAGLIDSSVQQFNDHLRQQLRSARDEAKSAWFKADESLEPSYEESKKTEEEVDIAIARAKSALVDAGLRKDPSKTVPATTATGGTSTPTAGRLFDVSNFVREKFTGEGEPEEALKSYRRFKLAWDAADVELTKKYTDVTDDTRLDKLKQGVSGSALELIAGIEAGTKDGYRLALEALAAKWDDAAALGAAHIRTLLRQESVTKKAKSVKQALTQLRALMPVLEAEEIQILDLLAVALVVPTLPADFQKNWKKDLHQKRIQGGDNWKKGEAIDTDKFVAWLETEAIGAPDQEEEETAAESVFLAGGSSATTGEKRIPGCILCGPTFKHRTVDCRNVSSVSHEVWHDACKRASACFKCFRPYNKAHNCMNTCMECGGPHHHLRCTKAKRDDGQSHPKGDKRPQNGNGKFGYGRASKRPRQENGGLDVIVKREVEKALATRQAPVAPAPVAPAPAGAAKRKNNKAKKRDKDAKPQKN